MGKIKQTPNKPKPWEASRAASGEKTKDLLYLAVGRALSSWEKLESEIAQLFCVFVGARWGGPAVQAYSAVVSFKSRANMIEAAANAFFSAATIGAKKENSGEADISKATREFKHLIKLCRLFSDRHNDIAHGIPVQIYFNDDYFLQRAYHAFKKRKAGAINAAYSYSSQYIAQYGFYFEELMQMSKALRPVISNIAKKVSAT